MFFFLGIAFFFLFSPMPMSWVIEVNNKFLLHEFIFHLSPIEFEFKSFESKLN